MDATVSLHHGAALPLPTSSSSHHRALHHLNPSSSSKQQQPRARLSATLARSSVAASAAAAPAVVEAQQKKKQSRLSSSCAATGYAAALADASILAGTLPRAARHARALLVSDDAAGVGAAGEDVRVVALVRMLVGKGKGDMVAYVMAEFVAICDRLLLPARARAAA